MKELNRRKYVSAAAGQRQLVLVRDTSPGVSHTRRATPYSNLHGVTLHLLKESGAKAEKESPPIKRPAGGRRREVEGDTPIPIDA